MKISYGLRLPCGCEFEHAYDGCVPQYCKQHHDDRNYKGNIKVWKKIENYPSPIELIENSL